LERGRDQITTKKVHFAEMSTFGTKRGEKSILDADGKRYCFSKNTCKKEKAGYFSE